ncbi:ATP synthase-coupling factor 6, mitochondrial-like [Liolophura sinensis]|uniref:ATP synthase-coupling factor 6, mitochondrial-like n=1 Tax=Liolophura sinensis TaxID=3198878 RepID=UPI003159737D
MLVQAVTRLSTARQCVLHHVRRNIAASAVLTQKAGALDPIQQLFVQKIREYGQKSKSAGGKLVDATAAQEKELKAELEKLDKLYGASGQDMTQFPSFNFSDPDLEPLGVNIEVKEVAESPAQQQQLQQEEERKESRPYFDY